MGLSHIQKMWPGRAIHRRADQPGLIEGKPSALRLEIHSLLTLRKWLSAGYIGKRTDPSLPYQLNPKTNNLSMAFSIKTNYKPNETLSKTFKVVMGLLDRGMALHKKKQTLGGCP